MKLFDGNGFNLHATAYDTEEVALQKYEDAADVLEEVRSILSMFVGEEYVWLLMMPARIFGWNLLGPLGAT